ncbi:F-box protein SKIP27-like [Phragmites australis]|uniref:F-box protein SKIP27-like n=1 Tax=Phragmites australis TaxID=29695 RepID=UPI002D78DEA9|nr:F-box protein SKIP27-like [Phragmites australis]XP_062188367.1 F-box protein SKIP27-like [Phragmites australis]
MAIGQGEAKKGSLATSLSFSNCRSSTRILGRKRVAVSLTPGSKSPHSPVHTLRKQRSTRLHMDDAVSLLESLPQDVLIKVLCKVNHGDLRQLFLVSKPVSEATIVARELHFAFTTPSPKAVFRDDECAEEDDDDGPGAPKQHRVSRSRLGGKNLATIAVNLSTSFESLLEV